MITRLVKFERSVIPNLPLWVWQAASLLLYYPLLKVSVKYADWKENNSTRSNNLLKNVPPPSLRIRVGGGLSEMSSESFVRIGRELSENIENILQVHLKRNLSSFEDVLDFGCGCGRVLVCLHGKTDVNYYGTDIDKDAILWCKDNLKFADFHVNSHAPPMIYKSESFDFIYSISVFTHIDEKLQLAWIRELHRLLKPNGILLISVLGSHSHKLLPKDARNKLQSDGFVFFKIFPSWYQLAYHTKEYIIRNFSDHFKQLAYIENGIRDQDAVLFQKNSS